VCTCVCVCVKLQGYFEYCFLICKWKFRFRSAWNRTDGFNFCNETTVNSPLLLGEDHPLNAFFCDSCEDTDTPLGTGLYMCSSFSEEEDWASGENIFISNVSAVDYAFIR
jgi:hypothetical protein